MFDEPEYSLLLLENVETGLILTHIIATDMDSTAPNNIFTYSFESGDFTYNGECAGVSAVQLNIVPCTFCTL